MLESPRTTDKPTEELPASNGGLNITRLLKPLRDPLGLLTAAGVGLFLLAFFYTLSAGKAFFVPIVLAFLLHRLFNPLVDRLQHWRLARPLGAGLLLAGVLTIVGTGGYYLAGPAASWLEEAPRHLRVVEYKMRGLKEQVQKLEKAAQEVEKAANVNGSEESQPAVTVQETGASSLPLSQTWQFLGGGAITFILLYFLLATGNLFLRKLVGVLPGFHRKRTAVTIFRRIEGDLSTYLSTVTLINLGMGSAVGLAMYILGMPSPLLWGAMAAVLNFVPYLGAIAGISTVGIAAIVTFETVSYALLAPGLYFLINATEGSFVTPAVMGQKLTMNPVAIFLALIFWGWIWDIPGALLAVPLLTTFKVICDNIHMLAPISAFLER